MIKRLRTVAKARFNASKRLEAKGAATNFGLQLANLYTIGIGILLLQFGGAATVVLHQASLNYISLVASVFVQIIALVESLKDYSGRARSMHECAIEANRICRRLEIDTRIDPGVLSQYQAEFDETIKSYHLNHDDIDYLSAQIDPTRIKTRTKIEWIWVSAFWLRYAWNVYSLTVFVLLLPLLCTIMLDKAQLW